MQMYKDVFAKFLMPFQVGVAVAGGMNLWTTAVECLLQSNHNNVIMSIDLSNMFNDVSRDRLGEPSCITIT